MANHLGPFPETSDGPEGQEQAVRAVGGQGALHGVAHFFSFHFLVVLFDYLDLDFPPAIFFFHPALPNHLYRIHQTHTGLQNLSPHHPFLVVSLDSLDLDFPPGLQNLSPHHQHTLPTEKYLYYKLVYLYIYLKV